MVNALAKQRSALENVLRACVGLPPVSNMALEFRLPEACRAAWREIGVTTEVGTSGVNHAKHPADHACANGSLNGAGEVGRHLGGMTDPAGKVIEEETKVCVKQPSGECSFYNGTGNANGLNGRGE